MHETFIHAGRLSLPATSAEKCEPGQLESLLGKIAALNANSSGATFQHEDQTIQAAPREGESLTRSEMLLLKEALLIVFVQKEETFHYLAIYGDNIAKILKINPDQEDIVPYASKILHQGASETLDSARGVLSIFYAFNEKELSCGVLE